MNAVIDRSKREEKRLVEELTLIGLMRGLKAKRITQNVAHFLIKEKGTFGHNERVVFKKWVRAIVLKTVKRYYSLEQSIKDNGGWTK